jgi:hypothetical protein
LRPDLKATFDTVNWEETPIKVEGSTIKLTRVRTERTFKGDVAGSAVTEYTFSYHPKDPAQQAPDAHGHGTVSYNGIMYFKGTIDGSEPGEVVFLIKDGLYDGVAKGELVVDERSAIGGLKGISGKAGYESKGCEGCPAWFEIEM